MAVRRRRECQKCGFRFSTYEEPEILNLSVVKRDGGREPYVREKLEAGVKKSFEKLAITEEDFRKLISRIERDIQTLGKQEVTSSQVGEIVMRQLKRTNDVAYIRFASVYRSFTDVESFRRELSSLKSGRKPKTSRTSSRRRRT